MPYQTQEVKDVRSKTVKSPSVACTPWLKMLRKTAIFLRRQGTRVFNVFEQVAEGNVRQTQIQYEFNMSKKAEGVCPCLLFLSVLTFYRILYFFIAQNTVFCRQNVHNCVDKCKSGVKSVKRDKILQVSTFFSLLRFRPCERTAERSFGFFKRFPKENCHPTAFSVMFFRRKLRQAFGCTQRG